MKYIEGLDRLKKKLDSYTDKGSVQEALTRSCLLVEADSKILCPVDDGQLRQSITYEVDNYTGAVGTNVEYAPYVHQGTGIFAVNGDGRKDRWCYKDEKGVWHTTRGQQPNPFLERALDINKNKIKQIFKDEIRGTDK